MKHQKSKEGSVKYIIGLSLVVALLMMFSVDVKPQNKDIYSTVEEMPAYPGGDAVMFKFISDNLKYPESAVKEGAEGRVIIRFVVGKTGEISDVTVVRGFNKACEEEAVRVINLMPNWTPGKQKGEAVAVYYTIPIVFKSKNSEVTDALKVAIREVRSDDKSPFHMVEQMPVYPGGDKALYQFISENLKYPESAVKEGTEGRVVIRYIVTETGEISDVTVLRGFDKACDEEAVRVIKLMPNWTPGKQNGENVAVFYTLPIIFKIPPKEVKTEKTNA